MAAPFGRDELALGQLEDVLPAVDDANAALGRALADVARAEPAVLERTLRLFFVSVIPRSLRACSVCVRMCVCCALCVVCVCVCVLCETMKGLGFGE